MSAFDIDLHRYRENGEVKYYSLAARQWYEDGIESVLFNAELTPKQDGKNETS